MAKPIREPRAASRQTADPRPSSRPHLSRRTFVHGGLGGAVALGLGGPALAHDARRGAVSTAAAGQAGPQSQGVNDRALLSLVHKATQGFTEDVWAQATALGYDDWLDRQLDYQSIDDSALDQILASLPSLSMSGPELYANYGGPGGNQQIPMRELRVANIGRSLYTKRQLYERMVEFWTDHLNIYQLNGSAGRLLKTLDDRTVVRAHALGRFGNLIHASAKSAAMLYYLDNYANVVGNPNENYARELMELHTLGVDGPYIENDVRELARCFTGWAFAVQPNNWADFVFRPQLHDFREKLVLGHTIPAGGGLTDAEFVIDQIVAHPATAQFVSRKLTSWLLGYDPPDALVTRVASVFKATDGDIAKVVRAILSRSSVESGADWPTAKHRRPYHFVISLLRQFKATVNNVRAVHDEIAVMGQAPYSWAPPDGYPDNIEAWGRAVLPRWSFASRLLGGEVQGVTVTPQTLLALLQGTPPPLAARRINEIMGWVLSPEDEAEVQAYVDGFANPGLPVFREAIALAASSPSYQYY